MKGMSSFRIAIRKRISGNTDKLNKDLPLDESLPAVHKAAALGELTKLQGIIKQDPSQLDLPNKYGMTPLAQAVQSQQIKVVKSLLSMGANIDSQDSIGRTPLSVAAYQGWHEGVVYLLAQGAKKTICDNAGRTPLHAATYHSDTNTLSLLLNSLTAKEINLPDNEMMTAVHWAAFHDRPDHLMQLIQRKADVLARDIDGRLPLHWAAQNGSFQCVHRLTSLKQGMEAVNEVDSTGKSAAHYAAAAGFANILTILSHCDNINLEVQDPDERTPLHWATALGHPKAVEVLLKCGANPLAMDADGCTPIEYARESAECNKVMDNYMTSVGSQVRKSRAFM